jgi:alkylated DNA repair protein alkB family protein 8
MSSSSSPRTTLPKSDLDACQLEHEHVHKVYNEIAHNFSDTRYKPWPRVVDFLRSFPSSSLILDIGCGNGKYLNTRHDLMMVKKLIFISDFVCHKCRLVAIEVKVF